MALAATLLTGNYDNVDRTSYTTASISPAANSCLLLFYVTRHATTGPTLTPSGPSGVTWTAITNQVDGISRLGMWRGTVSGSPGTGAVTLSIDGGVTAIGCHWHIIQVTGHDTSGTIVQSPVGATGSTGTSSSLTFAAAGASGNRFLSFHFHRANEATNPRTNWSELDDRAGSTPNGGSEVQWRNDGTNETTGSASWTTSSRWQSMGVEVKNLAGTAHALEATSGNGTSSTTADLIATYALASTDGVGGSSTAADLIATYALASSDGIGASSTTADLIATYALASTDAVGGSSTTADLTVSTTHQLEGTSAGASTTTAELALALPLAGTADGLSSAADAELDIAGAPVAHELEGLSAGSSGTDADLTVGRPEVHRAVLVPAFGKRHGRLVFLH